MYFGHACREHVAADESVGTNREGKLVDESNHPLPYANVVLLSLPDRICKWNHQW